MKRRKKLEVKMPRDRMSESLDLSPIPKRALKTILEVKIDSRLIPARPLGAKKVLQKIKKFFKSR